MGAAEAGDGAVPLLVPTLQREINMFLRSKVGGIAFCCRLSAETLQDHPVSGWEGGGSRMEGETSRKKLLFKILPLVMEM